MSRPFGVALLIAGFDENGPQLFHAEPSGTFYRFDAKAIGSGSEGAQAELQNEYHKVSFLAYTPYYKMPRQSANEDLLIVFNNCRCRDPGSQDAETSNGREAGLQKRAASQRHQRQGLQNIHR